MIAIMINFKHIQKTIEFIQHIMEEVSTSCDNVLRVTWTPI